MKGSRKNFVKFNEHTYMRLDIICWKLPAWAFFFPSGLSLLHTYFGFGDAQDMCPISPPPSTYVAHGNVHLKLLYSPKCFSLFVSTQIYNSPFPSHSTNVKSGGISTSPLFTCLCTAHDLSTVDGSSMKNSNGSPFGRKSSRLKIWTYTISNLYNTYFLKMNKVWE